MPAAIGFGCNTACVDAHDEATGARLVLDAGSGLVGLGRTLVSAPQTVPLLLTHFHSDHTQGLPFFAPLYNGTWQPEIYVPDFPDVSATWLPSIFGPPSFAVPFEQLPNRPRLQRVAEKSVQIGGFAVDVQPLTHPGGSMAYRIHGATGDLCYVTDHAFGTRAIDEPLAAFCQNCAALIADAHFTPDELPAHPGWGHSTWRQAAELASSCGAAQLWLFHHKPGRTDQELTRIVEEARRVFPATAAAREGLSFDI
jgi:phosphoribosyl 1,2-cyclic phosphodiesterase